MVSLRKHKVRHLTTQPNLTESVISVAALHKNVALNCINGCVYVLMSLHLQHTVANTLILDCFFLCFQQQTYLRMAPQLFLPRPLAGTYIQLWLPPVFLTFF